MVMRIVDWPPTLAYKMHDLIVDPATQSAGAPLIGDEQIVSSHAEHWRADITFNTLKQEWIKPYRALVAAAKGRYNAIAVPIFDGPNSFGPELTGATEAQGFDGVTFDDDTPFSDGWGFDASIAEYLSVSGSPHKGDTVVVLNAFTGTLQSSLQAGMYFMLGTYLYLAEAVTKDEATGHLTVDIDPPLREDIPFGIDTPTDVPFVWPPYLVCRFTEDLTGRHELDFGRFTQPKISVIEVVER
jgi:hypothetical protein